MARFNSEMYEKLYPRTEVREKEVIETAVETFNPTAEIEEVEEVKEVGDETNAGDEGDTGDAGDSNPTIE